jgi:hypothetical protein
VLTATPRREAIWGLVWVAAIMRISCSLGVNAGAILSAAGQARPTNNIRSLARIPVGVWLNWGNEYAPTSQTRRALSTWLGDPRSSRRLVPGASGYQIAVLTPMMPVP